MTTDDWNSVAEIYKQGIETGNATFQQNIPSWDECNKGHLSTCRIVAIQDLEIVGWAALTAVSGRCVYAGVAEVSVYVSDKYKGQKTISSRYFKFMYEEWKTDSFNSLFVK